jgi:tetratricopeptide (TPR) repeat protein
LRGQLPRWILKPLTLAAGAALLMSSSPLRAAASSVTVREENTVIPTYLAGAPEPNPMFYFGQSSQGAQAPSYPYPMHDVLTGVKADKTYKMVYLENEYLRIGILPEIGGRVLEGLDKTDNYNFVYRQHVIKPVLISILGAWISGGVEWNIPHHHRATTFEPVQYMVEDNADGSKTVWVGELELRQRMRWAVGYTLRPGKSYLEAKLRILNREPEANTMLCFANVAVHVNDNYQIIFPPSTQFGTGHSKTAFQRWPIDDSGVDISWYKNHPSSGSVFAWNYQDDFFAGYDHGKEAGVMSIADHNVVPGKKFFTWGTRDTSWRDSLTDSDGPYIELMAGAYSDNQPDYSWLQPYEVRSFSMNWYPFRGIGGVKQANLEAAVNLDVTNNTATVGFCTTSAYPAAKMTLKAGQKVLLEETAAINPGKPYLKQVPVPAGADPHDLVASISSGGRQLVSYSPIRLEPLPMPKPVTSPAAPAEIATTEELYLIGLRAWQFHSPNVDPNPYWEEALRRDPGDTRVNTTLGMIAFRQARYEDAEKSLRKALERLTDQYTSPKDVEAEYYLGVTLKAEGRTDEACAHLFKATWGEAWKAPAYYALAEITTGRGNMPAALELTERSISANAPNIRAQNLKAALMRHLGRPNDALQALAAAHDSDPLDVRSMAERWLASKSAAAAKTLASTMNDNPATAEETAAEYFDSGLWQDGTDVLLQMTAAAPNKSKINPMVYYYLEYFADKMGQAQKAAEFGRLAMTMPPDYVFPFETEAVEVLGQAMKANPRDARAPYYLGNLLYDWQPGQATRLWEASVALDPSFSIVHRNLAVAYSHNKSGKDLDKAIAELEKAVLCQPTYAAHFKELADLYEQTGTPMEKRLLVIEKSPAVVAQRDDAQYRAIAIKVAVGKYDDAIQMMTGRHFAVSEGANLDVGQHWTEAHILRARQLITDKRFPEAIADLQAAVLLPTNFPGGGGPGGAARRVEIAYWTGIACDGMGDSAKAAASWTNGTAPAPADGGRRGGGARGAGGRGGGGRGGRGGGGGGGGATAESYYQALCYQKLGDTERAKTMFQSLVDSGQTQLDQPQTAPAAGRGEDRGGRGGPTQPPGARSASAHYTLGLGYLGLNDLEKAKAEFSQAVALDPDLVGARTALAAIP